MPRVLTLFLVIVGVAVAVIAVLVLLAALTGPRMVGEVEIQSVGATVEVGINDDGIVSVQASSRRDLFAGLGYSHALRHAWAMTLYKTTASARRSETAADSAAVAIDHHIATLGIPADARRVYRALPDSLRALFNAYVDGVNASFERNRLIRSDEFIVLGLEHEAWEPWHPIAVEMLVAYLAASSGGLVGQDLRHAGIPQRVREFVVADSLLRETLLLDGFHHSVAFVAPDREGSSLFHRLVYGRSGIPLIQMAELSHGGPPLLVATIPGTLALPGGFGEDRGWALVPAIDADFSTSTARAPAPRFDRVVRHDGSEILVTSRRTRGRLFLEEGRHVAPAVAPDPDEDITDQEDLPDEDEEVDLTPQSAWWTFNWKGIEGGTDIRAWLALFDGSAPSLDLFSGGGLVYIRGGATQIFGAPAYTSQIPGGVVVGGSEGVLELADRLQMDRQYLPSVDSLGVDTYSTWAARIAPPLIRAIGHPDSVETRLRDPVAFLQGWDYRYDSYDIAASIFDRWIRVYRTNTGRLPHPDTLDLATVEQIDTVRVRFADVVAEEMAEARAEGRRPPAIADTLAERPELADSMVVRTRTSMQDTHDLRVLKHTFGQAIESLEAEFGRSGPAWRWYHVHDAQLRFPGRTDRPGAAPNARRYHDVPLADGGHPTAVRWGPSRLIEAAYHSASWSAWTSEQSPDQVFLLNREPFTEPLDTRYADPPEPTPLRIWTRGTPPERSIRLVPPP